MALKKLLYASRRTDPSDAALDRIITVSRTRNRDAGITGVLLYDDKRYLQLLEGDHDAIARCFLRIAMHPGHGGIEIGALDDTEVRLFTGWDMQVFSPTRAQPSLSTVWRRVIAEDRPDRLPRFEGILFEMLPRSTP